MKVLDFVTYTPLINSIPVTAPATPGGIAEFRTSTVFDLPVPVEIGDTVILSAALEATDNLGYNAQFTPTLGFGPDLDNAPEPFNAIDGGYGVVGSNITANSHHGVYHETTFYTPPATGVMHFLLNAQSDSSEAQPGDILLLSGGYLKALVLRRTKG